MTRASITSLQLFSEQLVPPGGCVTEASRLSRDSVLHGTEQLGKPDKDKLLDLQ